MMRVALTGNDAVAEAFRQVNPYVAAVYPITPQTEMMHRFAQYVADGDVDTVFVPVESEHSAMSACIGAACAGVRTITATSSQGLAFMWEELYIAAGLRLPIVMAVVNRALSSPINIHCDHSDTMGARDAGWIQLYSENAQEAYDNTIQAFRIAEHPDVLLPVMITLDGFVLSHTEETLELLEDHQVKKFVGEYEPAYSVLDVDNPITVGALFLPDYYFECKRQEQDAILKAPPVVEAVGREFEELSGRSYDFFEEYRLEDADVALVALGSVCGTIKDVVDELRSEGKNVGLLKLRMFRPFPAKELVSCLERIPILGVFEKAISFGLEGGPLFHEIRSVLHGKEIILQSFIGGLGGRDVSLDHIRTIYRILFETKKRGKPEELCTFIGVRD